MFFERPYAEIFIQTPDLMSRSFNLLSNLRLSLCILLATMNLGASAATPLSLNDTGQSNDLWPVVQILRDPDGRVTIEELLKTTAKFSPPQSAYATLGLSQKVVWLHAPVVVPVSGRVSANLSASTDEQWILDIDYALLNHIDVYVVANGRITQHAVLGNSLRAALRQIRSRSHAVSLALPPGMTYDLYLRVETAGAMILPITLSRFSAFHAAAINEQFIQGVLTSLGLCLLFYSLAQWVSRGERLYIKYSLLIIFSVLFSAHFFGIGALYLWTDNIWVERHMAGISALMASSGTALFIEEILREDMGRRLRLATKTLAALLAFAALAHAFDLIDISTVSVIMSTLGLLPSLLGVPGGIARMRRGDSVGMYFLLAWIGYFVASAVMVGVVKGNVGANFWSLHAFQFGATFDMLIFMRIAVLRSTAIHEAAQRAALERDSLHSLAHTDALTKLLNRRGLNTTLTAAVHNCTPEKLLAVYMLDLDGFKFVNDQFGHDVGDELLEIVASRLTATMRTGDGIARLGGDEFVVAAGGLQNDAQAKELGEKLVDAFKRPFALSQHTCHVGVTIGYALAPLDGNDAETLIKQADTAMYLGKQSGRNCLRRGVATAA
jgi:diguanylate cyclase (GGDEF)-like protein